MTQDKRVWIVGVGPLSVEYWKIVTSLDCGVSAIGRGAASARNYAEATGDEPHQGGLQNFLATRPELPEFAIVATGMEALARTTLQLIEYGVRRILVEKPGAMTYEELLMVRSHARSTGAEVTIAYNRRLFSSVLHARRMIVEDGGVQSFTFEFTEWSDRLMAVSKAPGVLERCVLGNSSHVIDLAFHLGGEPSQMECLTAGGFAWHPAASIFAGMGRSQTGALFSYAANWQSPGRWAAEFNTSNYRFIFRPMEKLQIVRKGSVQVEAVAVDDTLDVSFKPGLFIQTQRFLSGDLSELCSLDEQVRRWPIYERIAGYDHTPPSLGDLKALS